MLWVTPAWAMELSSVRVRMCRSTCCWVNGSVGQQMMAVSVAAGGADRGCLGMREGNVLRHGPSGEGTLVVESQCLANNRVALVSRDHSFRCFIIVNVKSAC